MKEWIVEFQIDFEREFLNFSENVRRELYAKASSLKVLGPSLGRPHADTLNASKHTNMKELRFNADNGVWRVAFAFDPERKAILLVAGDKTGVNQKKFYKDLIKKADERFETHLDVLKEKDNGNEY